MPVRYVSVGTRRDQIIEVGPREAAGARLERPTSWSSAPGPAGSRSAWPRSRPALGCVLLDRRTIVSTIERYPLGHDLLLHARADRDRRRPVHLQPREAHPARRAASTTGGWPSTTGSTSGPVRKCVDVAQEADGAFRVEVRRPHDAATYRAGAVVFATGYYDNPNFLDIPGEDLPHVVHYFIEGHPYWRRRVVVIGAGNSSVDAALECWRAGATVTLVHFGEGFDRTVKAWVLPDITNRVKEGSIAVRWRSPGPRHHADRGRDRERGERIGGVPARRRRPRDDRVPCRHHPAPPARRAGRSRDRRSGARRGARWPRRSPASTSRA